MKIKQILIVLFIIAHVYAIYCEDTAANIQPTPTPTLRNKTDYFMKFRGTLTLALATIFEHQDGIYQANRFNPVSYEGIDYTDDQRYGDDGRVVGGLNSLPLAEIYLDYDFIAPFFKMDNFLMSNNHIKFSLYGQLSIVTLNGGMGITISPAAFLELQAGFLIGTAWSIPMGAGLGINNNGTIERFSLAGPHLQLWFSATLQFDLAYIVPEPFKKWTHWFFILTPQLKYQAFLGISENQPYMYQECPGEKLNGWNLMGKFIFGYRYYFIEDDTGDDRTFIKMKNNDFWIAAGILLWIEYFNLSHYNDSPMADGWGSDFAYISFGPMVRLELPWNYFVQLFYLFGNEKAYTDDTVGYLDYRDRKYEDWYIYSRWIGAYIGWKF